MSTASVTATRTPRHRLSRRFRAVAEPDVMAFGLAYRLESHVCVGSLEVFVDRGKITPQLVDDLRTFVAAPAWAGRDPRVIPQKRIAAMLLDYCTTREDHRAVRGWSRFDMLTRFGSARR
jgi:hypothetical protein